MEKNIANTNISILGPLTQSKNFEGDKSIFPKGPNLTNGCKLVSLTLPQFESITVQCKSVSTAFLELNDQISKQIKASKPNYLQFAEAIQKASSVHGNASSAFVTGLMSAVENLKSKIANEVGEIQNKVSSDYKVAEAVSNSQYTKALDIANNIKSTIDNSKSPFKPVTNPEFKDYVSWFEANEGQSTNAYCFSEPKGFFPVDIEEYFRELEQFKELHQNLRHASSFVKGLITKIRYSVKSGLYQIIPLIKSLFHYMDRIFTIEKVLDVTKISQIFKHSNFLQWPMPNKGMRLIASTR